jgi:hypothetical protein
MRLANEIEFDKTRERAIGLTKLGSLTTGRDCGRIKGCKQIWQDVRQTGNRRLGTPIPLGVADNMTKD